MLSDYSTSYILKLYAFMNLIFILLLLSNDMTFFLLFLQLLTLYFGMGTIYCMIEGDCKKQVFWIFIFYFIGHIASLFLAKGFFPRIMTIIKKIDRIGKKILERKTNELKNEINYSLVE